jgi:succinate dehydrogenase / fumarate reductase, flavoprotein subunit
VNSAVNAAVSAGGGTRHDPRVPIGPLAGAWQRYRQDLPLISAAQKRQLRVLVVGSGLAGASAAASLAEQGYMVSLITYHDSPRRAHSVAAQGGINAAKNYANDGDSVTRLFRDTVKGGDFRAREAGCFRLAELSTAIIDQCVAQGVPFAREYGGTLANRSFGGTLVSRTFYARGQTGQQLLYGAYAGAVAAGGSGPDLSLLPRRDLVELVWSMAWRGEWFAGTSSAANWRRTPRMPWYWRAVVTRTSTTSPPMR